MRVLAGRSAVMPAAVLLLALLSGGAGCTTDPATAFADCEQICADLDRRCYQDACAMVDDADSLCARRCRERRQACDTDCAKP